MSLQGVILIDLVAIGFIILIINLLRSQRLTLGLGLIWLFAVASLMIMVSFTTVMEFVTRIVGATYPASALSLLAFIFIFLVLISISMQISIISARQIDLIQTIALLEADIRKGSPTSAERVEGS
jgi:hypothetical protein